MNIDNLARTINRRLKDFFDIFGADSREYRTIYNQVRGSLSGSVFRPEGISKGDKFQAPLQISRSKQALNEINPSEIYALNEVQKRQPSARQRRSDYAKKARSDGKKFTRDFVKRRAALLGEFDRNRAEIYATAKENDDQEMLELFSRINDYDGESIIYELVQQYHEYLDQQDNYDSDFTDDDILFEGDLGDVFGV